MKKYAFLGSALMLLTLAAGCSDEQALVMGEGSLRLTTAIKSDVKLARSAADEDALAQSCVIWISSNKGVVRKYNGIADVPSGDITLSSGHYVAEAWAGDSVPASFEARSFYGNQPFEIKTGEATYVELNCKIANVVASVKYDDSVDAVLHDYTMTVGHTYGQLIFEGKDTRKGYFMMPSTDTDLAWTLTGTKADGTIYTRSGVLPNVKRAYEYVLNVNFNQGGEAEVGGGYFTIEVVENPIEINETITLVAPPTIIGVGFDINQTQFGEKGGIGQKRVHIAGATQLKSVILSNPNLASLLGIDGSEVDLLLFTDETFLPAAKDHGLSWHQSYDPNEDIAQMTVTFSSEFTDALADGDYPFTFTATDVNDKTTVRTLMLSITAAVVTLDATDNNLIWADRATVAGHFIKDTDNKESVQMRYRAKGTMAWTTVPATVSGNNFSAQLTGLNPATTYQYNPVFGDVECPTIMEFTTDTADQLPNAGFEEWNTSSTPYLIYKNGGQMFWDSGNHGSATMSKNVTVPATNIKHSGAYSIKLESQFVGVGAIGKFAAGNVFIGKYLETQGTNGVLGVGRPFDKRPKALKGYIHYTPQPVTDTTISGVSKGDMDEGIIYFALVDDYKMDGTYKDYPVVLRTKDGQFFDQYPEEHIIARGQKIFTEATPGTDMVQFEIPFNYNTQTRRPKYIVMVCAASKNGDYFTGGPSVMYLDDLELVY